MSLLIASQICYDLILIPIPNIDKAVPCRYAINSKLEINVPNTFLTELKKQKITLSLHQQDEWEDYFTTNKTEINHLQTQITQTDNEIDQMVYELYGLTDEEIGIVEGG